MPSRQFTYGTDNEGSEGWLMKGMPHFDASQGMGVAHDTIEHFNNGSRLEDELLAFGSILFGRGEGGYWLINSRQGERATFAYNTSGDLARFLAQAHLVVEPTKPLLLEQHMEAMLEDLPGFVLADIADELECYMYNEEPTEAQILSAIGHAINWIRKGYLKASKRFDCCPSFIASMFQEIEKEVDSLNPDVGDKLTVQFDLDGLNWLVTHKPQYNW